MTIDLLRDEITVTRRAAYVALGVGVGILVNLFGFWARTPSLESGEVLPVKMATGAATLNLQSTVFSIAVVVVLALVCAFVVGAVAKKKLT